MAIKKEIKKDEVKEQKTVFRSVPLTSKKPVEFGIWLASRADKIPANCHREIIWADFNTRGLKEIDLAENYDKALVKFGIKL